MVTLKQVKTQYQSNNMIMCIVGQLTRLQGQCKWKTRYLCDISLEMKLIRGNGSYRSDPKWLKQWSQVKFLVYHTVKGAVGRRKNV